MGPLYCDPFELVYGVSKLFLVYPSRDLLFVSFRSFEEKKPGVVFSLFSRLNQDQPLRLGPPMDFST